MMSPAFAAHVVVNVLTIATLLMLVALLVGLLTRRRHPAIEHAFWVVVLLRLIVPPILPIAITGLPQLPATDQGLASNSRIEIPSVAKTRPERSPEFLKTNTLDEAQRYLEPTVAGPESQLRQPIEETASEIDASASDVESSANPNMPVAADATLNATAPPPTVDSDAAPQIPATTMPVTAKTEPTGGWPLLGIAVPFWVFGTLLVLLITLRNLKHFRRLLSLAEPAQANLLCDVQRLATQMGLSSSRTPDVRVLAAPIPPMIWSRVGRCTLVLPRDLPAMRERETRELLLAHELAHVGRRDHWVRWIELLATMLWWWCPIFWFARKRLRDAEEMACDASVLRHWPERASQYAATIVDTIDFVAENTVPRQLATGSLGPLRSLRERISSIQTGNASPGNPRASFTLSLLLAVAICPLLLVGKPLGSEADATPVAQPQQPRTDEKVAAGQLPPQCDPTYEVAAPNKKLTAYVGSLSLDDGTRQYGLFVHDWATNQTRRLLSKALKTTPAWSPDSKRLAIGNAASYVANYPLVVVDVETGNVDETGAFGVGAAWSPNGRYIAVSTEIIRGGSWSAGIPCDGRIGIWDTQTRTMQTISPPARNQSDRDGKFWFLSGSIRPLWSPDSNWVAWTQSVSLRHDGNSDTRREIWLAKRNGDSLQKVFDQATQPRWSTDSKSMIDETTGETKSIVQGGSKRDSFPNTPDELAQLLAKEQQGQRRAEAFDAQQILEPNRLWQNPDLSKLSSITFTHKMSPEVLDEAFQWQSDGTTSVEVVHRGDEPQRYGQGWMEIGAPDGATYTYANRDAFPRYRTPSEVVKNDKSATRLKLPATELMRRKTLRRISGTRLNFPSLDWGRRPNDFVVSDFQIRDDKRMVELRSKPGRRSVLNVGAMFETTSWSYLHDIRITRSMLTIDNANRILSEEVFAGDEKLATITFSDFASRGSQHAPRHIEIDVPKHQFRTEHRFKIAQDVLWILEEGTSTFAGKTPQKETIADIKLNDSASDLTGRLQKARQKHAELTQVEDASTPVTIQGLTPVELGHEHELEPATKTGSPRSARSLTFMPADSSRNLAGQWPTSTLSAEIRTRSMTPSRDQSFLLSLYDAQKQPMYCVTIPSTAVAVANRPADELVAILNNHQFWLRAKRDDEARIQYTFRFSDRTEEADTDSGYGQIRRGVTLTTALDALAFDSKQWKVPVCFEGQHDGRPVKVFGLTSGGFSQIFGSGLKGTYVGGYTSTRRNSVLVVVDAETGYPLVERSSSFEFQFHDYIKTDSGQAVPLRVLCKTKTMNMDLRFQLLNGRYWLFDRRIAPEGVAGMHTEAITIDGEPPTSVVRSEAEVGNGNTPWFDWTKLNQRQPCDPNDGFSATIASSPQPWLHPSWETMTGLSVQRLAGNQNLIRANMTSYPQLGSARYWTLTDVDRTTATPLVSRKTIDSPVGRTVSGVPMLFDKPLATGRNAEQKTRLQQLRFEKTRPDRLSVASTIVSTNWYTDQSTRVTSLLADRNGVVFAGGFVSDSFRTHATPVISQPQHAVVQTPLVSRAHHALVAGQSVVTGGPMGSTWGTYYSHGPLFPVEALLKNRNAKVRLHGLRQLYLEQHRWVQRRYEKLQRGRDDRRVIDQLAKHRQSLVKILDQEVLNDLPESLSIACRLAGFSANRDYIKVLRKRQQHSSPEVQQSATIALGMLGEKDTIDALRIIAAETSDELNQSLLDQNARQEAQWALSQLEKTQPSKSKSR